jgi:hypothetical protein
MVETLLGGIFGGALRLAPEVLKWFDRKNEREHELKLLGLEHEFAKTRAESEMRLAETALMGKELDALGTAFKEQGVMAAAGGKIVAGINALVRPTVTYMFIAGYFLVKLAMYMLALDQGGAWNTVLVSLWTQDDMTVLFMIISFWFVGRVYERKQH